MQLITLLTDHCTTISLEKAILATATAISAFLAFTLFHNLYLHPLRNVPAVNIWAAWSDWWSTYRALWCQDRVFVLDDAHKQVGKIIRFAPNMVVIADATYCRQILGTRLSKIPASAGFTTNRGIPNAFSAIHQAEASGKRKGMLPHYSQSNLQAWQDVFDRHMPKLIGVIDQLGPDEAIDVLSLIAHAIIDILGEIVLDKDISTLADYARGVRNPVARAVSLWPKRGIVKGILPGWIWGIVSLYPGEWWQHVVESDDVLADFVAPLVHEARMKPTPERPSLIHRLSSSIDTHTGNLWEVDHVISECTDHFLAGTETTTTTLAYCLWTLATRPDIVKTLQGELDEATGEDVLSMGTSAILPYLNAVAKEALRLFPASPGAKLRVLGQKGLQVDEHYLPCGTIVGVAPWTTHRLESVWGSDALIFRPERWLEGVTPAQQTSFQPFTTGGRSCPGMNLALIDLRIIIGMLVRNFDIFPARSTTIDSMNPRDLETLYPVSGECRLHFTRRKLL